MHRKKRDHCLGIESRTLSLGGDTTTPWDNVIPFNLITTEKWSHFGHIYERTRSLLCAQDSSARP